MDLNKTEVPEPGHVLMQTGMKEVVPDGRIYLFFINFYGLVVVELFVFKTSSTPKAF